MPVLATTRMSSKGQVVIPEELRREFGWNAGTSFIVVGRSDAIMLQPVAMPDMARFDDMVAESRRQAEAAGMRVGDVAAAVARVRAKKRRS